MAELAPVQQVEIQERQQEITEKKRIETTRSWGLAHIEERDMAMIAFSRAIGFEAAGRTVVSKFINGTLETNPTRVVLAIEQYRAQIEGSDGISSVVGFREIRSATRLWAQADAARDGHRMAAVIGYTGYGKSEAIKQYQRKTRGDRKPPIRVIEVNCLTNAPYLARKLAQEMGLADHGEPAWMLDLVVKRLRSHPEFLIVDEANYLQERCLHILRYLHDTTRTGILLAGTPVFLAMVANRANGAGAYGTAAPDGPRPPDGPLALFADRIFSEILPGVMDDEVEEITEDVLKASLTAGGLSRLIFYVNHNMRLLTRIIIELREFRKKTKQIDEKIVEAAWAKLNRITT